MIISFKNTKVITFLVFLCSAMSFSIFKIEYPLFIFALTLPFLIQQNQLFSTIISDIKKLSWLLVFSSILTCMAHASLFFCFDISKTLISIFSFWLIPLSIMLVSFLVFLKLRFDPTKVTMLILGIFLLAHIVATIFQWIVFNQPRSAGLAMGQTPIIPYSIFLSLGLCYSICLFYFTIYKKTAFTSFILSIIALYANGSRCLILVIISLLLFSIIFFKCTEKRPIVILSIFTIFLVLVSILNLNHQRSNRFDFYSIFTNIPKILQSSPSSIGQYDRDCFLVDQKYLCDPQSLIQQNKPKLDPSFLNRISLYKSAFLIVMDNPLRPNGYNQHYFKYNIPSDTDPSNLPYPRDKDGLSYYGEIHNSFLSAFFEMGIIGGLAYIAFFAYLFIIGIRHKNFFSTLLAMFTLSISIIALFDIPLGSGTTACFSFFIFGMCLGMIHRKDSL